MVEFKFLSDEKVKMHLSVDEVSESVKVKLEPKSEILWKGNFLTRPKINSDKINHLRTYFQVPQHLQLESKLLDQSRIHPRYAKYFNNQYKLLHKLLFAENISPQTIHYSYSDGLSFIGNALLQFVASLIVFYENPENTPNGIMEQHVRYMVDSTYLASLCQYSGWDSMLAHNSKNPIIDSKKGEKVYTDQLKGWLGALYASNPIENLPEVLEVAKKMLSLKTDLTFKSLVKPEYNHNIFILGTCIGFSFGTIITGIVSCAMIYYTSL